jgi:hypothetical protein
MRLMHKVTATCLLLGAAIALAATPRHSAPLPAEQTQEPTPAFHDQAPKGDLPETMSPLTFPDTLVQNAYIVAARVKKTLYQEPCYCHCDQSQGHGSLLDCFVSRHGSGCNICMGEAFYSYEQLKKGKTSAQIREGIMKGEWQSVDLSKYQKPLPAKSK